MHFIQYLHLYMFPKFTFIKSQYFHCSWQFINRLFNHLYNVLYHHKFHVEVPIEYLIRYLFNYLDNHCQ